MKYLKYIKFAIVIIFIIAVYILYKIDFKYSNNILFLFIPLLFFVDTIIFFNFLKKSLFIIEPSKKTKKQKIYFGSILIISIVLVIFSLFNISKNNIYIIFIGFYFIFITINIRKEKIYLSDKYIATKSYNNYTLWQDINEYEIKNNSILMIRTPYLIYEIDFIDISKDKLKGIVNLLNIKLFQIFKGILTFDNQELIIKND